MSEEPPAAPPPRPGAQPPNDGTQPLPSTPPPAQPAPEAPEAQPSAQPAPESGAEQPAATAAEPPPAAPSRRWARARGFARHRATQLVAVGLLGLILGGGIVALADRDGGRGDRGGPGRFDDRGHSRYYDHGPGDRGPGPGPEFDHRHR